MGKGDNIKYVVVCFSLYQDRAIHYRKCNSVDEMLDSVKKCVEKQAHVMSIRMYIPTSENEDEKGKEKATLLRFLNAT